MIDGQLLQCQNCIQSGKQQYLGKVATNGDLIVLRFHHGTTLIKASNYEITCGCGFTYQVSGTTVSTLAPLYDSSN